MSQMFHYSKRAINLFFSVRLAITEQKDMTKRVEYEWNCEIEAEESKILSWKDFIEANNSIVTQHTSCPDQVIFCHQMICYLKFSLRGSLSKCSKNYTFQLSELKEFYARAAENLKTEILKEEDAKPLLRDEVIR
jgi:hypothetical protein